MKAMRRRIALQKNFVQNPVEALFHFAKALECARVPASLL